MIFDKIRDEYAFGYDDVKMTVEVLIPSSQVRLCNLVKFASTLMPYFLVFITVVPCTVQWSVGLQLCEGLEVFSVVVSITVSCTVQWSVRLLLFEGRGVTSKFLKALALQS